MKIKSSFFSTGVLPFFIFILSIGITLFGWHSSLKNLEHRKHVRFESRVQDISARIRERAGVYIDALYGARGLFAASNSVEAGEWRAYVAQLQMEKRYPGIFALGYIQKISRKEKEAAVEDIRSNAGFREAGYPEFKIYPEQEKSEYYPITFVEPSLPGNMIFGYDLSTSESLSQVLMKSAESNAPHISGKIHFPQPEMKEADIFIAMPVYKHDSKIDTVEGRKQALEGFVIAIIEPRLLFSKILNFSRRDWRIDFEIYDRQVMKDEHLLYDNDSVLDSVHNTNASFSVTLPVTILDRTFALHATGDPDFGSNDSVGNQLPLYVLFGGFVFSWFLYFFLNVLIFGRAKAEKYAEEKHQDLIKEIAERRAAEESLWRSNEMRNAIIHGANFSIISTDVNGLIQTFNATAEKMLGYSAKEMVGRSTPEVIHVAEEVANRARSLSRELGREIKPGFEVFVAKPKLGKPDEQDWTYVRKDGVRFPVRLSVTPLKDNRGEITGFLGIAGDLSETRKAQAELLAYKTALDHHASVAVTDKAGVIIYANDRFCEVSKYARHELIGKTHQIVNSGYHPVSFFTDMWDTILSGLVWQGEICNRSKDGTLYWMETTITPIKDLNGEITHFVAVRTDITELRQSRERVEMALKGGDLGLWDWNIQTGDIFFNERLTSMLGYGLGEMAPRIEAWEKLVHPEDKPRVKEILRQHLSGETINCETEHRLLKKNGEWIWVLNKGKTLEWDKEGKPLRAVGTHLDITEKKNAEQKIQEAAKAKSDFTSMVSHELRTPLMVIQESIGIVHDGSAGPINADQLSFLDKAKKNVERLARLINNVLDYQKLDAGKSIFQKKIDSLNDITREVVNDYHEVAIKRGLEIDLFLCEDMPKVMLDRDKIIQVLANYLNNAIKFSKEGKIFVSTGHEGNTVKVSVTDNGPGIREEDQDKLFSSFSQLGEANERKTGGTGLGLVISKQIIEAHGGKVGVESSFGKGATFYFILPIVERRISQEKS